jgi:uncharacterized protein
VSRVAALVFAKAPRPGTSKTRLAAGVGPDGAARLAAAFLADTVAALREQDVDVILSTPDPGEDHGVEVEQWDQGAGELGARIERTFARALDRFPVAVALGADSPGLPPEHLRAVLGPWSAAEDVQAMLASTDDGGFWALRLDHFPPGMLLGVGWSRPTTAAETAERLVAHGFEVRAGPRWWDVDTADDLRRVRREVPRERAPRTHQVLDALGWPR